MDSIVVVVKHDSFLKHKKYIANALKKDKTLFDIKGLFDRKYFEKKGIKVWSL